MEAADLISTGYLMLRHDARCCLAAMGAAALLVADAWFDVTTAPPGAGVGWSAALALLTELPAAAGSRRVPHAGGARPSSRPCGAGRDRAAPRRPCGSR